MVYMAYAWEYKIAKVPKGRGWTVLRRRLRPPPVVSQNWHQAIKVGHKVPTETEAFEALITHLNKNRRTTR